MAWTPPLASLFGQYEYSITLGIRVYSSGMGTWLNSGQKELDQGLFVSARLIAIRI